MSTARHQATETVAEENSSIMGSSDEEDEEKGQGKIKLEMNSPLEKKPGDIWTYAGIAFDKEQYETICG